MVRLLEILFVGWQTVDEQATNAKATKLQRLTEIYFQCPLDNFRGVDHGISPCQQRIFFC